MFEIEGVKYSKKSKNHKKNKKIKNHKKNKKITKIITKKIT